MALARVTSRFQRAPDLYETGQRVAGQTAVQCQGHVHGAQHHPAQSHHPAGRQIRVEIHPDPERNQIGDSATPKQGTATEAIDLVQKPSFRFRVKTVAPIFLVLSFYIVLAFLAVLSPFCQGWDVCWSVPALSYESCCRAIVFPSVERLELQYKSH